MAVTDIVVVVEVPVNGVVAVDTVEVVVVVCVDVRPTCSDSILTSLPLNPQPTTPSRSACISDLRYTRAPAKGRGTRGGGRTKENMATPWLLKNLSETSVSRYVLTAANSESGSLSLWLVGFLALPLIFCDALHLQSGERCLFLAVVRQVAVR